MRGNALRTHHSGSPVAAGFLGVSNKAIAKPPCAPNFRGQEVVWLTLPSSYSAPLPSLVEVPEGRNAVFNWSPHGLSASLQKGWVSIPFAGEEAPLYQLAHQRLLQGLGRITLPHPVSTARCFWSMV